MITHCNNKKTSVMTSLATNHVLFTRDNYLGLDKAIHNYYNLILARKLILDYQNVMVANRYSNSAIDRLLGVGWMTCELITI